MTSRRPTSMTLIAVLFALALIAAPFAANAQGNNNIIPTLDGAGLATLAGGLAIAGSWLAARRHRRK